MTNYMEEIIMKRNKSFLFIITAFLSLFIAFGAIKQTTSAHSFTWWSHPRTVVVTKKTRIYKIKPRYPLYKSRCIKKSWLKKGSKLKINHVASYTWIIHKKGYVDHFNKPLGQFWTANRSKGWFKLATKKVKKSNTPTTVKQVVTKPTEQSTDDSTTTVTTKPTETITPLDTSEGLTAQIHEALQKTGADKDAAEKQIAEELGITASENNLDNSLKNYNQESENTKNWVLHGGAGYNNNVNWIQNN